jgi:CHASE2 domain-containing sensor protein/class 3 adenylate cyclase
MSNLQHLKQLLLNPLTLVLHYTASVARIVILGVAAIVSIIILLLLQPGLQTFEERLGAWGWTLYPDTTPEQRITLVAIDEKSLAEVGPWPWSRQQLAELVSAIDQAGAQLQLHDIVYPEARAGDAALLSALQSARGAVIAQLPALQPDQTTRAGLMTHPLNGVSCTATGGLQLGNATGFLAPHSGFAAIPKGHITPVIASDGAIHKTPAVVCVEGAAYPALALTALLQAGISETWDGSISPGSSPFDAAFVLRFDGYPGLEIPLDREGNLRISYANAPSVYRAISAVDVINGTADISILDNAWVLVGGTAFGMGDIIPTPYNGATAGLELQARLLGSLLDVAMPYTPRASIWLLGLLGLIFTAALYALAAVRGRLAAYGLPFAAVLLPLLALTLHIQLLNSFNLWLGWLFPALYGTTAASLLLLLEQSRVRVERGRVYDNLNSYLPDDIAREIAYSLPSSAINARRSDVTLLSADLRNFSAFGEARPPEEAAAVLHFFFTRATEIVEQHGGRVHEFKGDSLLAVWDGRHRSEAALALNAAQAMHSELHDSLMPEQGPVGLEPLALGIGIEQGPVLIGSIGPAHRRSHVLLGDTVGITLRVQEMTSELAQPILLGECAARQLDDLPLESQGSYLLSGLNTPHVLFAPALPQVSAQKQVSNAPALKVLPGGRR